RCFEIQARSLSPFPSGPRARALHSSGFRTLAGQPLRPQTCSGLLLALRSSPAGEYGPPGALPPLFFGEAGGPLVPAAPAKLAHHLTDHCWIYFVALAAAVSHLRALYLAAW